MPGGQGARDARTTMRSQFFSLTFLFLGGGVGTLLRFGVASALKSASRSSHFPFGTLAVNVVGCFAIGVLWQLLAGPWGVREDVRIAILVGLLGGFTTFSSFGLETMQLWGDGQHGRAIAYVVLSNLLGLIGVWAGLATFAPKGGTA